MSLRSLPALRAWLHAEIKRVDADFDLHVKDAGGRCLSSCTDATEYRALLATYKHVLKKVGGKCK